MSGMTGSMENPLDGEDQNGNQDQLEDDAGDGVEESAADKCLPAEGGTGETEEQPANETPDDAAGNHSNDQGNPDVPLLFRQKPV